MIAAATALGAAREMPEGFFRTPAAGRTGGEETTTICWRLALRVSSCSVAATAAELACISGSALMAGTGCQFTPRICTQMLPCSSHRSISNFSISASNFPVFSAPGLPEA